MSPHAAGARAVALEERREYACVGNTDRGHRVLGGEYLLIDKEDRQGFAIVRQVRVLVPNGSEGYLERHVIRSDPRILPNAVGVVALNLASILPWAAHARHYPLQGPRCRSCSSGISEILQIAAEARPQASSRRIDFT